MLAPSCRLTLSGYDQSGAGLLGRASSPAAPIRPIPTVGVVAARQVSWTRPMGWAWAACDWRLSRLHCGSSDASSAGRGRASGRAARNAVCTATLVASRAAQDQSTFGYPLAKIAERKSIDCSVSQVKVWMLSRSADRRESRLAIRAAQANKKHAAASKAQAPLVGATS